MIDTENPLLQTLADDFVDLHRVGGIELEQWETAYKFVKHFYHTEEVVEIRIGGQFNVVPSTSYLLGNLVFSD